MIRFGVVTRDSKNKNANWPGPGDTNVHYQPNEKGLYTNGRRTTFPKNLCPKPGEKADFKDDIREKDGLGPGAYTVKMPKVAPIFSFGTRFNSSIRSKDHLRPAKSDGPGPGSHKLPSTVEVQKRHKDSTQASTFGNSGRQISNLPLDGPAPNKYHPIHFTEASHVYSFPRAVDNVEILKDGQRIGPGEYKNMVGMAESNYLAKSILGGALHPVSKKDDDVPGPAAYTLNPIHTIPGFVIKPADSKSLKEVDKSKDPVGPQRYNPVNPNHKKSDHNHKGTIGNAERGEMVAAVNVPGPGKYIIQSDFDKAVEHPRFHMGVRVTGITGKNMDQPGPGEYETDVIPAHHSNITHFIGTSVRSDLGIGKAYMFPGPGEYEAQIDSAMDPRIRIAGTFGTDKKDTVIKKTFAPGPGSYDLPNSVGLMPQYLRTEENRAIKAA